MKQFRIKKAKQNQIRVGVSKTKEGLDIVASHDGIDKSNVNFVLLNFTSNRFKFNGYPDVDPSFIVDLIDRGFDITTLDFKIDKIDEADQDAIDTNRYLRSVFERI